MLPASSKGGGLCFAFPDVCLTPSAPSPIPIPYPNLAQCANASNTCSKVFFDGKEALTEISKIASSSGDEAGTNGGVMSGVNRDEVSYKTTSKKVYADNKLVVMMTSTTAHNGSSANNPAGLQVSPSQTKVLLMN